MLKTLRTSTKWVMITVAVCFVMMMVFAWGMDITGLRGGSKAGVVGVINGRKVMYDEFNQILQNRRETMPKDTRMTLDAERKLNEDTWNQIVMQTLISQEIKKRKISYTEKELLNFMLSNPVQGVEKASIFLNPDGTFSQEKYRQFLLNPNNLKDPQIAQFLQGVEDQAKSSLPIMKLQQRIAGGVLVSDSKVHDQWLQENDKRKIDFIFLPAGNSPLPSSNWMKKKYRPGTMDTRTITRVKTDVPSISSSSV